MNAVRPTLSGLNIPQINLGTMEKLEESTEASQVAYVVRHGECPLNLVDSKTNLRYITGRSLGSPLTEEGIKQAENLASQLASKIPKDAQVVVCSSTAVRAHETALCLVRQLKETFSCTFGGEYEGLCERSQGEWEGSLRDKNYEEKLIPWNALPAFKKFTTSHIEGSESYEKVGERALSSMQEIFEKYRNKTLFLVSHGNTINALALALNSKAEEFSKEENSQLPSLFIGNCEMIQVKIPSGEKIQNGRVTAYLKV